MTGAHFIVGISFLDWSSILWSFLDLHNVVWSADYILFAIFFPHWGNQVASTRTFFSEFSVIPLKLKHRPSTATRKIRVKVVVPKLKSAHLLGIRGHAQLEQCTAMMVLISQTPSIMIYIFKLQKNTALQNLMLISYLNFFGKISKFLCFSTTLKKHSTWLSYEKKKRWSLPNHQISWWYES